MGWWGGGGVVAYEILVSPQGPLVLGFWAKGLGPGLDDRLSPPYTQLFSMKEASIDQINNELFAVAL